jgi:hypothetical protein
MTGSTERLARSLAGYLCGTHSGLLVRRRGDRLGPEGIAREHRLLQETADAGMTVGAAPWDPGEDAMALRTGLAEHLEHNAVLDLVVFGSQARRTTTGFSDVDAVLVIEDDVAENPDRLRALRPRVLAAERCVLHHQPMQHHGFEVVTRKLLAAGGAPLQAPAEAFLGSRSLRGAGMAVRFGQERPAEQAAERLTQIGDQLRSIDRWPGHPWRLHRTISMFELLPALFLQSRGHRVTKSESFTRARSGLQSDWSPYEQLEDVRANWPRLRRPLLELGFAMARNPWTAVDLWTRLPDRPPESVSGALTPQCLTGLHALAREMVEAVP